MKTPILTLAALLAFTFFALQGFAGTVSELPNKATKKDSNATSAVVVEYHDDMDMEVSEDGSITMNPVENLIMETVTNYVEVEFDEDFDIEVDEEGNITVNPIEKFLKLSGTKTSSKQ